MSSRRFVSGFVVAAMAALSLLLIGPTGWLSPAWGSPQFEKKKKKALPPPPAQYLSFTDEALHFRFWYPASGWVVSPHLPDAVAEVTDSAGNRFTVLHSNLEFPLNLDELGNEFIEVESDVLRKDFPSVQIHSAKFVEFHKARAIEFKYEYTSESKAQAAKEIVIIRGRDLLRLRTSSTQSDSRSKEPLLTWMLGNFYFFESLTTAPTIPTPMPALAAEFIPRNEKSTSAPPAITSPSASTPAQGIYQEARQEYLKFTFASAGKAVQLYRKAINANPSFALAYAGQAEALAWRAVLLQTHVIASESGEARAALELAEQGAKLNREHVAVQRALAWAYFLNGDEKNTEKALKKAQQLNSSDAETNLVIATTHLNDPEQLLADCQTTLGVNPSSAGALYLQGMALLKLGRHFEAMESFDKLIRISPEFAEAYFESAHLLVLADQNDEALTRFQKAISLNPKLMAAHFQLAVLFERLNRVDEAIHQYKAALQVDPTLPQPYYNLGALFADEKKDIPQATRYFKKFLELTKDEAKANQVRMWLELNPQ